MNLGSNALQVMAQSLSRPYLQSRTCLGISFIGLLLLFGRLYEIAMHPKGRVPNPSYIALMAFLSLSLKSIIHSS